MDEKNPVFEKMIQHYIGQLEKDNVPAAQELANCVNLLKRVKTKKITEEIEQQVLTLRDKYDELRGLVAPEPEKVPIQQIQQFIHDKNNELEKIRVRIDKNIQGIHNSTINLIADLTKRATDIPITLGTIVEQITTVFNPSYQLIIDSALKAKNQKLIHTVLNDINDFMKNNTVKIQHFEEFLKSIWLNYTANLVVYYKCTIYTELFKKFNEILSTIAGKNNISKPKNELKLNIIQTYNTLMRDINTFFLVEPNVTKSINDVLMHIQGSFNINLDINAYDMQELKYHYDQFKKIIDPMTRTNDE